MLLKKKRDTEDKKPLITWCAAVLSASQRHFPVTFLVSEDGYGPELNRADTLSLSFLHCPALVSVSLCLSALQGLLLCMVGGGYLASVV